MLHFAAPWKTSQKCAPGDSALIPAPYYPAFDNDLEVLAGVKPWAVRTGTPPRYAIIGSGGHATDVLMAIAFDGKAVVCGVYDDNPANHGKLIEGVPCRGGSADAPEGASWLICIGQNEVRKKISEKFGETANGGEPFWPAGASRVSESATVGAGTFVAADVRIHPRARIGRHCILNPGCLIGHDVVVGDYGFVGAHAVLGGHATVGEGAVVGLGCVLAPGRTRQPKLAPTTSALGTVARPGTDAKAMAQILSEGILSDEL